MARININEFSGQAGGVAYRVNQVRTDPAVVKAAQDAWADVRDASRSCTVLGREVNASWQRSRTTPPQSGGYRAGHPVSSTVTPDQAPGQAPGVMQGATPGQTPTQDRPAYRAAS